jgi:hypothetical protein
MPPNFSDVVAVSTLEVALRSVRRRPRLARTTEAVMRFVEDEVARVLAADPGVTAARQRAMRRAGRATARSIAPGLAALH